MSVLPVKVYEPDSATCLFLTLRHETDSCDVLDFISLYTISSGALLFLMLLGEADSDAAQHLGRYMKPIPLLCCSLFCHAKQILVCFLFRASLHEDDPAALLFLMLGM